MEPSSVATSAIAACDVVEAAGAWWNQDFPEQAGQFTVELDATPSAGALDAVVGLSAAAAGNFAALAAIVRFNAAGTVDVRDGAGYRADVAYAYAAGRRYHVRLSVDTSRRVYTVAIREGSAGDTTIATAYAFRTEQAGANRLNHVAAKVDSTAGPLEVCGVSVTPASGGTCTTVHAGDGFASVPLPDATGYESLSLTVQASAGDIDAVFGLSTGPATAFSQLATAVRLAPTGVIDARDGGGYRADVSRTYSTAAKRLRMISDLSTHTYSVFELVALSPPDVLELARQFRFRTEQAAATHLDHLSAIVDSDHGSAIICVTASVPSTVAYIREGFWSAAPFPDDSAVLSSNGTTTRVDTSGRVVATVNAGGRLAADALGHSYLARVANDTVTVEQYDASLALVWSAGRATAPGSVVRALAGFADGSSAVATGTQSDLNTTLVVRFTPAGAIAVALTLPGSAVALDTDRILSTWLDSGTVYAAAHTYGGVQLWQRAFTGRASITAIVVDPGHNLVFGGDFQTAIDFGGGPLTPVQTDDGQVNGFVVKLSSTGDHIFSGRIGWNTVTGLATNGIKIAASGTRRTQFFYHQLKVFDASTAPSSDAQLSDNGRGGGVAMAPSGRIWWSFEDQFQLFTAFPYMFALRP